MFVKHLKLTPNHEDFELKKLLVNELVLLSRDPCALLVSSVPYSQITFWLGFCLDAYVKLNLRNDDIQ